MEVFTILIFFLGLAIGSFLNVLIDRLPAGKSLGGRSICDHCKRVLSVVELVPVLSWLIQKGYSRCCKKRLSEQYPLVELTTGLVFAGVWLRFSSEPFIAGVMMVIAAALIVITVVDMRERIIPDYMTLTIIISAVILSTLSGQLVQNFLAGIILFGLLFVMHMLTKGKGMGFGDVKFAFAIGLLLGLWEGFIAIYIAFLLGGVVGGAMLLGGRKKLTSKIAFGPFLVAGTVVMLLWGEWVLEVVEKYLMI